RDRPGRGRRGGDVRVGAVRRNSRHHPRHALVRALGTDEGGRSTFRLRAEPGGCRGARAAGAPAGTGPCWTGPRVSGRRVLTINAGSSSLKAAVYLTDGNRSEVRLLRLEASRIGRSGSWLQVLGADGCRLFDGEQELPDFG